MESIEYTLEAKRVCHLQPHRCSQPPNATCISRSLVLLVQSVRLLLTLSISICVLAAGHDAAVSEQAGSLTSEGRRGTWAHLIVSQAPNKRPDAAQSRDEHAARALRFRVYQPSMCGLGGRQRRFDSRCHPRLITNTQARRQCLCPIC